MLPDVRPTIQEEVGIRLYLRVPDSHMCLEGMPDIRTAVAHQLHPRFVFAVPRDELAPDILEGPLPYEHVVAARPVVYQPRLWLYPMRQRRTYHFAAWHAGLRKHGAEPVAMGVERHLEVAVLCYGTIVGYVPLDFGFACPRRRKPHLVDPYRATQATLGCPRIRGIKAPIAPVLHSPFAHGSHLCHDPIRAIIHY